MTINNREFKGGKNMGALRRVGMERVYRGLDRAATRVSRFCREVKLGMKITFGGGMAPALAGQNVRRNLFCGAGAKEQNPSLLFFRAKPKEEQVKLDDFSLEDQNIIGRVAFKDMKYSAPGVASIKTIIGTIKSVSDIVEVFKGISQKGKALFFLNQSVEARVLTLEAIDHELLATLMMGLNDVGRLREIAAGIELTHNPGFDDYDKIVCAMQHIKRGHSAEEARKIGEAVWKAWELPRELFPDMSRL